MISSKNLYVETQTHVNVSTGEVERVISTTIKTVKSEQFIQIYLEDLSGIFNLETRVEIRLIALMWRDSTPNIDGSDEGNRVVVVKEIKEMWAKEAEATLQTINNTLTRLVQKEILIKKGRSIYVLNPKLFFKGSLKDRPKVIEKTLIYKIDYAKEVQSDSKG